MIRMFNIFLMLGMGFSASSQPKHQDSIFIKTDQFLKEYVINGRVDYKRLFTNADELNALTDRISAQDLEGQAENFKKAFYINAYNLLVISGVLEHYPVQSPMEITGFFKKKMFVVAGEEMTLDHLEFDVLFTDYRDLRLHFVLNCGAISCPTLYEQAIIPEEIDEQLDFRTTMVMNRDDYVRVDEDNKQIVVSQIFEWYKDMFQEGGHSIRRFIDHNRFEPLPYKYSIVFDEYNWSLNSTD